MFCGLVINGTAMVPSYYGARSLSLGYSSSAFTTDINSIFINPAILNYNQNSMAGYQYQNSYLDVRNFSDNLSDILDTNLKNYAGLSENDKSVVFQKLKELYRYKTGIYGFSSSVPGFIGGKYGFSVSVVRTAILNPQNSTGTSIFEKDPQAVTNEEIAALKMNFLGLKYKQFSLAYGLTITQSVSIGVTLHYLTGKINDFDSSITDSIFIQSANSRDYLEYGWKNAGSDGGKNFSRIMSDVGISMSLGSYVYAGVVMKNIGKAKISGPRQDIQLPRRITAGLAFRPDSQWGVYLDIDLKKEELVWNGDGMQPISIGIEKSFFKNKFFVRGGMLNDLSGKQFLGKESNALFGLGLGFNIGSVDIDAGIGLNSKGLVKNLAISGFIITK